VKRFYKSVTVQRAELSDINVGDGPPETQAYTVSLDGRAVRTPGKAYLWVPNTALAEAIAEEWRGQGDDIEPAQMDLTRIANAAVDRVVPRRRAVIDDLVNYGVADLVCYRADAPVELIRRQTETWQPLVDWARDQYGAELIVGAGIMPIEQPANVPDALAAACGKFSNHQLAAISLIGGATGSTIIALALAEGHLGVDGTVAAASLDDTYQTEHWGEEQTAAERRAALVHDIEVAARFLLLFRQT